jgi:hypothetical protein
MKRTFLSDHGLIGMSLEARLMVIDAILDEDESTPDERRELLLNHELLAAAAEFHLMYTFMVQDEFGCEHLTLNHGNRAWNIYECSEFLNFLRQDAGHLTLLTSLVREALFARFIEDAASAAA